LKESTFSLKSGNTEQKYLQLWETSELYQKSFFRNRGDFLAGKAKRFVLHDGPPYANGKLHVGHALNKVMKDVLTKFFRMRGYWSPFVPGWDCHGLPVELKALEELKQKDPTSVHALKPKDVRDACRAYAAKWVEHQKEEFKKMGVLALWDKPYLTMNSTFEADTLRVFGKYVENGNVMRKWMTVPWCASCETVLAKAEMEYRNKRDPSVYVLFPMTLESSSKLRSEFDLPEKVYMLAWTTTPWTLPMNRGLAVSEFGTLVAVMMGDKCCVMEEASVNELAAFMKLTPKVLGKVRSSFFLENRVLVHPPFSNTPVPVVVDQLVSLKEKNEQEKEAKSKSFKNALPTGVVHLAPGCGVEDYQAGLKHNLEPFSPVSSSGHYTDLVGVKDFVGKHTLQEGQSLVVVELEKRNLLLYQARLDHSYPHCWRCKNPLLFRTTLQWFCSLNDLQEQVRKNVDKVDFYPAVGQKNFSSVLEARSEWCVSRQRTWGVPVPSLLCKNCPEGYFVSKEFVEKVAEGVEKEGLDFWENLNTSKFLVRCTNCGNNDPKLFQKEKDVLDVWFDSGVTHYSVSKCYDLPVPFDLMLEGKDQYRGWFQSSFLCSSVSFGKLCSSRVFVHGFVVDGKGKKMSKSDSNGVSPDTLRKQYNADVLRVWVCSSDPTQDVAMTPEHMACAAEDYKKLRSAFRFMLSQLYDFDPSKLVPFEKLFPTDQYLLALTNDLYRNMLASFEKFDVCSAFHMFMNFVRTTLSAFYFGVVKGRLYFENPDSLQRVTCQSTLYLVLESLVKLLAPMLSYLAEEVYQHLHPSKVFDSVHLQNLDEPVDGWKHMSSMLKVSVLDVQQSWSKLFAVRKLVNQEVEKEKANRKLTTNSEARLVLTLPNDPDLERLVTTFHCVDTFYPYSLADYFLVSECELRTGSEVVVNLEKSPFEACPRCRRVCSETDSLCERCSKTVKEK
jgi:isoleucyl-tRNA synthetase